MIQSRSWRTDHGSPVVDGERLAARPRARRPRRRRLRRAGRAPAASRGRGRALRGRGGRGARRRASARPWRSGSASAGRTPPRGAAGRRRSRRRARVQPERTHADVVVDALDAGCHVLVEKPLCLSVDDADRVIAARDRAGRVVQVAYMKRFDPAYEALLEDLAASSATSSPTSRRSPSTRAWPSTSAPFVAPRAGRAGRRRPAAERSADGRARARRQRGARASSRRSAWPPARRGPRRLRPPRRRPWRAAPRCCPDGLRWTMAWALLRTRARSASGSSCSAPDGVRRLEFPAPYLRQSPTSYTSMRRDPRGNEQRTFRSWRESYARQLAHFHACVVDGAACRTPPEQARADIALLAALHDATQVAAAVRAGRRSSPGSDSGIGRATALALADAGHDVGITWRTDEAGAAATARLVRARGRRAAVAPARARRPTRGGGDRLAGGRARRARPLVNNAGANHRAALVDDDARRLAARARGQPHRTRASARRRRRAACCGRARAAGSCTSPRSTSTCRCARAAAYSRRQGGAGMATQVIALELAPHGDHGQRGRARPHRDADDRQGRRRRRPFALPQIPLGRPGAPGRSPRSSRTSSRRPRRT